LFGRVSSRHVATWLVAGLVSGCGPGSPSTSSPPAASASHGALASATPTSVPGPERLRLRVVATYPHDGSCYTQGLVWSAGRLFESCGRYGASSLRRVALESGAIEVERALEPEYFGEGLAQVGDALIQITWREGVAFRYRLDTLAPLDRVRYRGEGWGLAYDGARLILSDGSHLLRFLDPVLLEETGRVLVRERGIIRDHLNELEWVNGSIYANVYETDQIVRIDPASGDVTAVIDAGGLLTPEQALRAEVLNGIAYRPESGTFLLTGKYWPLLFEVELEVVPERP
jgi:glutaminyl-peptide cyclotransferase